MGGSHSHEPPPKYWRHLNIVDFGDKYEPEKRIIERPISKLDKRQQWEIVFHDINKKIFKLRNIEKNTFLYLGQEPKEGIPEFSTIKLENEMYKYDPAYVAITPNEIENKTDFSFISSFGTQMDIVDKNNINMANDNKKENKLQTIKATRVRITTQMNEYLNIFGVFIYGPDENVLNTNERYAYSSSNYLNKWPAGNVIKIVNENSNRKAYDSIQNKPLNGKSIGWNKWHPNNAYAVHTYNDNTGVGGGSWWEYEFNDPVDISLIEIFGRTDCCPNRNKLRVDLYNDNESRTKVIWTTKFDDMLYDAHKVIKITNE
jgi:hypothetical protein